MKFYITRWVIARGIVVLDGRFHQNQGQHKMHVFAPLPSHPNRLDMFTLGRDAFLHLDEARDDAERRFETHLARTRVVLQNAEKAMELLKKDRELLQVHTEPVSISTCRAFKEIEDP